MFEVIGKTTGGKLVINNLFKMYDTHGLPLSLALGLLHEKGMVPSWELFVKDAFKAGWDRKKIIAAVDEVFQDCGIEEYRVNRAENMAKLKILVGE